MTTLENVWTVPSIMGEGINGLVENLLNDVSSSFDSVKKGVPYDVIQIKKDKELTGYKLRYALAGYRKDQISLEVKDQKLNVKTTKAEQNNSNESYLQKGISTKNFNQSIHLNPRNIDYEGIKSSFVDGILEVTLPFQKEVLDSKKSIPILIN